MSVFEIDLDWEFDAPKWVDLLKEDNSNPDDWFLKLEKPKRTKIPKNIPLKKKESPDAESENDLHPKKPTRIPISRTRQKFQSSNQLLENKANTESKPAFCLFASKAKDTFNRRSVRIPTVGI